MSDLGYFEPRVAATLHWTVCPRELQYLGDQGHGSSSRTVSVCGLRGVQQSRYAITIFGREEQHGAMKKKNKKQNESSPNAKTKQHT